LPDYMVTKSVKPLTMTNDNIDALLIRVKFNPFFDQSRVYDESLGLLSLATYSKKFNHNVLVLNEPHVTIELIDDIIKVNRIKLLGFYVDADNVFTTLSIINLIKERYPALICVVGGPQVSAVPWDERIIKESKCDIVVRGEGEKTLSYILSSIKNGKLDLSKLSGVSYISKGVFTRSPDAETFDLKEAPIPNRSLTYFPSTPTGVETIYTSKGCPYHCVFCFEGLKGRGYRTRSIKDVISEVEYLLESRNMRYLLVLDNLFTVDPKRVMSISTKLQELQGKYHTFNWYCEGRANVIRKNPHIIKAMINAGLMRLQIGIETGNENVLQYYEKELTLDDIREAVKLCYDECLISMVGNFIVGGPFETRSTLEKSIDFAKELLEMAPGCIDLTVSIYGPYPSTKMYVEPERFGIEMIDRDCITGSAMDYVFSRTQELSKWEILKAKDLFTQEIESKATSLVPRVSEERLTKHFKALYDRGMHTMWTKVASKNRNYHNYYGLIVTEGKRTLNDVMDNIDSYKPLRTMPIRDAVDGKITVRMDDGRTLELSELSSRIYELCSGKITTLDIIDILYNEQQVDQAVLRAYTVNMFKELDKEKLVVFSPI